MAAIHYLAILYVRLNKPVEASDPGSGSGYSSYSISLGVCASDITQALEFCCQNVLREAPQEDRIEAAEIEEVDREEIPDHVLSSATSPIDRPGVYWTSGRIYGKDKSE